MPGRNEVDMTRTAREAIFAGRRLRAGGSFLAVAVILAATSVSVGLAVSALAAAEQRSVVAFVAQSFEVAAVWMALPLGLYLVATAGEPPRWRTLLAVAVAVAAPVLVQLTGAAGSPFTILLALAAAVAGYALIVFGLAEHRPEPVRPARVGVAVGALAAANLAVVALGTLHLLVWNPLAKVPDRGLAEIYATIAGRSGVVDLAPVVWAVVSTAVTVGVSAGALFAARRGLVNAHQVVTGGLLLVHATSFFLWWAGFGIGMDLADAFATSGADASPIGSLLALTGAACLAAAILMQLRAPSATPADLPDDGPRPVTPVTVTP
jgi:hypothetical protein